MIFSPFSKHQLSTKLYLLFVKLIFWLPTFEGCALFSIVIKQLLFQYKSPDQTVIKRVGSHFNSEMITLQVNVPFRVKMCLNSKLCDEIMMRIMNMWLYCFVCCSTGGDHEDSLVLCTAMLSLHKWGLDLMLKCIHKLHEDKQSVEYIVLVERTCDITSVLVTNPANKALLYVAHLHNKG